MTSNSTRGAFRPALPLAGAGLILAACTVMPTAPSVVSLPGSSKSIPEFHADAADCTAYANAVLGAGSAGPVANANAAQANAAVGSAIAGAAFGALIGSATHQAGEGAAIGAGLGALFGASAATPYASMSSYQLQRAFDRAYLACMYERGNKVPVRGYAGPSRPTYASPGPTAGYRPPPDIGIPPPGTPPPPGVR